MSQNPPFTLPLSAPNGDMLSKTLTDMNFFGGFPDCFHQLFSTGRDIASKKHASAVRGIVVS